MKHTFSIILLYFCTAILNAQTRNGLDPTFGDRGIILCPDEYTYAGGVAIQPDGKIITSGAIPATRYLPDGSLDSSFGTNGSFKTSAFDTLPFVPLAKNILLQPNGKIILCFTADEYDFILIRLKPNGTSDSTFGLNGIFAPQNYYSSNGPDGGSALQADGKILVFGTVFGGDTSFISRVDANGKIDSSFGTDGYAKRFLHNGRITGIGTASDGRIVIAGESYDWSGAETIIAQRYLHNGTLDTSFGNGGESINYLPSLSYCRALIVQADNKIVLLGSTANDAYLLRLSTNGIADPTFGQAGIFTAANTGVPRAFTQLPDGRFVCGGDDDDYKDFFLMRVKADGASLDSTFGTNGYLYTDIQGRDYDRIEAIALQSDGKIVVAGDSRRPDDIHLATIARYLPNAPSSINRLSDLWSGVYAYPNPAKELLNIAFERGTHQFEIKLVSSSGSIILANKNTGQYSIINISSLALGIYQLIITEGNKYFTQTIQKQ